jgi:hypothetical protein
MTEQSAVLTAATATNARQRKAISDALRSSPFAQMIGKLWQGASILIRVRDDEDLESIVSGIRSRIESVSGARYRRDA